MNKIIRLFSSLGLSVLTVTAFGQAWWPQSSNANPAINLLDINFDDNFLGFSFGESASTMVKTTNGGANWGALAPSFTNGNIQCSSFPDPTNNNIIIAVGIHDIVGGDGIVMKTTNGGSNWTVDTNIPEKLLSVSFTSAANGWISGENGYIARTTDGGTNWQQLTTGTGEDIFSVDFVNGNEGWAVGTVDTSAVILNTTNGGTNWTLQNSGVSNPLFSVFFVNNLNGWAVGASGTILATTNGGISWNIQTSGTSEDLFDLHFVDASNGWIVGAAGTILKTTDAGVNWVSEASGTNQDLHSIDMESTTSGWLCGDAGLIHVYAINPPNNIEEINNSIMNNIKIYPNPAQHWINVELIGKHKKWKIELYDIMGRLVREQKVTKNSLLLSREGLEKGTYMLVAINENGFANATRIVFD